MRYLLMGIVLFFMLSSLLSAESQDKTEPVVITNETLKEWRKNGEGESSSSPPARQELRELGNLEQEVRLLNLINGLELSPEQTQFILQKAQEAKALRKKCNAEIQRHSQALEEVLGDLKDDLVEGKNTSSSRPRVFRAKHKVDELKDELTEQINAIAKEVEGKLEGHQIYALERFVPCLIPPEEGNRIGQAEGAKGFAQQLQRIRNIPSSHFLRIQEKIVDKALERIKKHVRRGQIIDEDKERERIAAFFKEIRSLSEADFLLRKEEIAEEFMAPYVQNKLAVDISVRIERYLLSPAVISLLEAKMSSTDDS